jgi:hypothetical protein
MRRALRCSRARRQPCRRRRQAEGMLSAQVVSESSFLEFQLRLGGSLLWRLVSWAISLCMWCCTCVKLLERGWKAHRRLSIWPGGACKHDAAPAAQADMLQEARRGATSGSCPKAGIGPFQKMHPSAPHTIRIPPSPHLFILSDALRAENRAHGGILQCSDLGIPLQTSTPIRLARAVLASHFSCCKHADKKAESW